MTVSARLAEFVLGTRLADTPEAARVQMRRAALDSVGVMLAGASEPVARITRTVARVEGGAPLCTVVGSGLRTSPTWAALCNGAAGHAHDFDDTSFALLGHPSVPLLATALAIGEAEAADGAAVMLAYLVGFEASTALGVALNPGHYTRGWHATATIGTIGCAAAAARLAKLEMPQTIQALGIAASLASGLKENFGSMTKPYHAGHAALNAVTAVALARAGMTASATALEGTQGFAAAFGDVKLSSAAFDDLGREWQIVASGIAVKPYPSCALTHSAIDALIDLRARHGVTPEQVDDVEVGVNHVVPEVLRHPVPTNALERKFSMPFCAAAALAQGRVGLDDFFDGPEAPAISALLPRVRMVVDPTLPDRLEQHAWSRVTVRLKDGRTLAEPPRGASGHPDMPLSDVQLRDKFLGCTAGVLSRGDAEAIADQLARIDAVPDIRALTARLATKGE
jgi:2-methylcitrate dehydratase PrpD